MRLAISAASHRRRHRSHDFRDLPTEAAPSFVSSFFSLELSSLTRFASGSKAARSSRRGSRRRRPAIGSLCCSCSCFRSLLLGRFSSLSSAVADSCAGTVWAARCCGIRKAVRHAAMEYRLQCSQINLLGVHSLLLQVIEGRPLLIYLTSHGRAMLASLTKRLRHHTSPQYPTDRCTYCMMGCVYSGGAAAPYLPDLIRRAMAQAGRCDAVALHVHQLIDA